MKPKNLFVKVYMQQRGILFEPLKLPCGVTLKNRIAKSAMSDSLGDGTGHPTAEQIRLYQRWAGGGLAVSIIGEVQGNAAYAEKPGNLVLNETSDLDRFRELAQQGSENGTELWLQLGHAGALAYAPTSAPNGPSALDLRGLRCGELSIEEIHRLPFEFARTARLARLAGFGGVQIHAAHGFLLSQFLSPLFNKRSDEYGGAIANRMRLLLEAVDATRAAVGPDFPIAVKLNSSDQLEGGLDEDDALEVVAALDRSSVDLIDMSGGTYFPGAKSASDGAGPGPYFLKFAKRARAMTTKPLMLTGGFKTRAQAEDAVASGAIDIVGLARALVLEPSLPDLWKADQKPEPAFPRFASAPEGGITAWYTMRLTEIGEDRENEDLGDLQRAIRDYEARDKARTEVWLRHFANDVV
ncbi:NADH:flavin oxidoreductase/NADH oxidase family protein [Aurantimonas sp. C2-6-R+9]|uniref:NADH:flavin oxidoreductase/NADH oxidase family protein n=1 Tax=unclassified Aurantimonas TaxID=2638230 RepID=UPI002E17DAE9|nr:MULTISPECIES: NADH:flavin oxidoreductase/NADH oxidase family protein [unclassified Aurantimonas]MEC5292458.1 NADH:flavin oxidoreductase/NADH oxidase family protein [Aurantimonas sp. C2-3-R2]MEC5382606.1 NADH:flavin oxidoreductase/NADH oxidase family protein [Aurantimonas sp. C2-6-R+9]MEC5413610.1 NADH:flavin oxidoreductase/NADH oxidase family protein [Aurantimonas sp. C2-4-R8]